MILALSVHTSFRFYTPGTLSNNYGSASVLLYFSHTQTYLICLVYLKQKAWEFSKPSDLRSPSALKYSLQKKTIDVISYVCMKCKIMKQTCQVQIFFRVKSIPCHSGVYFYHCQRERKLRKYK